MAERSIGDNWLTKQQVAERLGRSIAAVTRLQAKDLLHPLRDVDGTNRYDPDEVDQVISNIDVTRSLRKEEYADYELSVVKDVVDLVRVPREKIDDLLFRIIERQEKQIEGMLVQRDKDRAMVDAAKDNAAEREMATDLIKSETRVKEFAVNKFIQTVSSILTNGKSNGVQLSPEQLEALLLEEGFLSAEQQNAAKKAVIMYKENLKKEALADAAKAKAIEAKGETSNDQK